MSTDFGSLMKRRVKKVSQVCTPRTNSGFSAPRVHTLSAVSTAGPSRKVKGGKRSRPGFRPRSKGKGIAAWEDDQQDTAFWGKGKGKGKGKKGKKGMMKGKDSFKGMPSWKGKGKGDAKNKGGNNPFLSQPPQANVAQAATSSASQVPENKKQPMPKKAGVMTMTHIGQMTGQVMNPTMDMMETAPKVIGTIGLISLPLRN